MPSLLLAAWVSTASPGDAGAASAPAPMAPAPMPWRCVGKPSFTVDTAAFPDSAGWRLEVYVRIPPEDLVFLGAEGDRQSPLRLLVRLENRFGAKLREITQDFSLSQTDMASGFGQVVVLNIPVKPGEHRLKVRLHDLASRKRGLWYAGRHVPESAAVEGTVVVPGEQQGVKLGDLEFLWQAEPGNEASIFRHGNTAMVPNPDRLFGLYASTLRAYFQEWGPVDGRDWRWHARILRGGKTVAERESTAVAGTLVEGLVEMDVSTLSAGAYDLELKLWREGDTVALQRSGRFSVAWLLDSWRRSPRDLADEVHFLLDGDTEERFLAMQPGEQEAFLADFWKRRDPSAETAENELRQTYLDRIAYANEHFGYKKLEKGMFTDMGRVYIRYGAPSDIQYQVIPTGDKTLYQVLQEMALSEDALLGNVREKGRGGDMRPFEVWVYENVTPLPLEIEPEHAEDLRRRDKITFLFVDEQGYGRYTLRYSTE